MCTLDQWTFASYAGRPGATFVMRCRSHCGSCSWLLTNSRHKLLSSRKRPGTAAARSGSWVSLFCLFGIDFDSTLGYPGEGPQSNHKLWSLSTLNVGSLKTTNFWKGNDDQVYCLQETRIGRNNWKTSQAAVAATHKTLFSGDLLSGILRNDGHHITMHGGTAILASDVFARPFSVLDDASGKYQSLFASKRANACWIQATHSVKILVFSFYGKSGASANHELLQQNDNLLTDIFEIAAQFGDIPVIVAGDFQTLPHNYPSVASAIHFDGWSDPLVTIDQNGETVRPVTFSKDRTFTAFGEGNSSLDAILTNRVAFAALQSIDVIESLETQHRPIRAFFKWEVISQVGTVHCKFAPFDHANTIRPTGKVGCAADQNASNLWRSCYQSRVEAANSFDCKWKIINEFCTSSLLDNGAKWGSGKRVRGEMPLFRRKRLFPGQTPSGAAISLKGSLLYNTMNRLWELFTRAQRFSRKPSDQKIFQRTTWRVFSTLQDLGSPHLWPPDVQPSLVDIHANLSWIKSEIQHWEEQCKRKRINAWKTKIQESASGNLKFIFHHLRNKTKDEPTNLVLDPQGNIVFDPHRAIAAINDQWDDIFSANALHEDPIRMLDTVWPYLDHDLPKFDLPPLTGQEIFRTIQSRNPMAAAGLDGWRTADTQLLPWSCCDAIASFFRDLEEAYDCDIPKVLACAKQIILHKPGPASPLNKRLITVLPPLFLAYSGTRFRHLQEWQAKVFPTNLCGAIKNRYMSDISVGLRLEIDQAKSSGEHIVGIKLDQSKCFDRIVPAFAAALFLAFGMPKGIVNMFLKLYGALTKHLSFRGWTESIATTAANGVAQGCSLSLLAINAYMAVWSKFVSLIPGISAKAFIDDAYLWTKITNLHNLRVAFEVSQKWNDLVGQQLNPSKSSLWATSPNARKEAKQFLGNIPLVKEFDALGTKIYTSERLCFLFDDAKVSKISMDIKNISALPIPGKIKQRLLAMKVIPQFTFAADISSIPKKALNQLESEIATALWGHRPHWRSKGLVFTLLSQPCYAEPTVARAYTAVRNFWRFVHQHPESLCLLRELFHDSLQNQHSFLKHITNALSVFHLALFPNMQVGIGSIKFNILEVQIRDLKPFLLVMGRQHAYENVSFRTRKDVKRPTGLLDFDLSSCFRQFYKPVLGEPSLIPHFESQQVGCTITNDRRCAAGFTESSLCRFCQQTKESLLHIVEDCDHVPPHLQIGPKHDLGPNFVGLGLVEHPVAICDVRLQQVSLPEVATFRASDPCQRLWTDGSLVLQESYWLQTAAYAVVNVHREVVAKGRVNHFSLSSYTAELFAGVAAFVTSSVPVEIITDCKTVVNMFFELIELGTVPPNWAHREWWTFFWQVYRDRDIGNGSPCSFVWMPAHQCDDVPLHDIDEEISKRVGWPVDHLICNRLADITAKQLAWDLAPINPQIFKHLQHECFARQSGLARLNQFIGSDCPVKNVYATKEEALPESSQIGYESRFPEWDWNPQLSSFGWIPGASHDIAAECGNLCSETDCDTLSSFLLSLKWKIHKDCSVAYVELAFIFAARDFKLEEIAPPCTFGDLTKFLKRVCDQVFALHHQKFLPGKHERDQSHSCGRALPRGAIFGARSFISKDELTGFARLIMEGGGRTLKTWQFELSTCRA